MQFCGLNCFKENCLSVDGIWIDTYDEKLMKNPLKLPKDSTKLIRKIIIENEIQKCICQMPHACKNVFI